jgi:hypothetical protein
MNQRSSAHTRGAVSSAPNLVADLFPRRMIPYLRHCGVDTEFAEVGVLLFSTIFQEPLDVGQ